MAAAMPMLALSVWLAQAASGMQFDYQLHAQNQVRAGNSYTPGVTQASTLSIAEIASPGGRLHLTFRRAAQDLAISYTPRFLDTYRKPLGSGPDSAGQWTGWSQLHRVLINYKAGDERELLFVALGNIVAGQLDLTSPDGLVAESGYLPGAIGQTLSYINSNVSFALTRRVGQHLRLASVQTLGLIQYPLQDAVGYFQGMPGLVNQTKTSASEKQLRVGNRSGAEWILNSHLSVLAELEFTDVSYLQTASFPALTPSISLVARTRGKGSLRLHAGLMRYWINPIPGVVEKPGYLAVADVTFDRTWADIGLPHVSTHMVARIAPFYNLQFASLEPRATVMMQLEYKPNRTFSLNATGRVLSSQYWEFGHFRRLQRGHPKDIFLASLGVRYSWREMLIFDASLFGSSQSYVASSTLPYTQLDQVYVLLGLQWVWPRARGSHG